VLGGFNLIEADDMDEALRIAAELPWARTGCVGVRPVRDIGAVRRRVGAVVAWRFERLPRAPPRSRSPVNVLRRLALAPPAGTAVRFPGEHSPMSLRAPGPVRDEVVESTRAWIDHAVIGLNLCPFAWAV
jgi:hypothetical protein